MTGIDLRGCGKSDCPDSGYQVRDFADDLACLCAQLEIEKPVIIGHSLGGMIPVEVAARYPSLPRALVLVDPGPIAPLPDTPKTPLGRVLLAVPALVELVRDLVHNPVGSRPGGIETRRRISLMSMTRSALYG